jgi:predicted ATP-binding protein involved in virulence
MRVNHLSLSHFRGFKELDIDFSATNLTVFIGTNGRGKSSILDLIAIHLTKIIGNLNLLERRVGPNSMAYGNVRLRQQDINNDAEMTSSEISISDNNSETLFKEFENLLNILTLTRNTSASFEDFSKANARFKNGFGEYCTNLHEKIKNNPFGSLPILTYYQANRTVHSEISNRDKSPRYSLPQLNALENAFVKQENDFDEYFTWFRMEEDKENESIRREKNFDLRNPQLELVRLAVTQFFSLMSGDKYRNLRIERSDNPPNLGLRHNKYPRSTSATFVIDKNAESLSLDQLSDGEKSALILVCDIARRLAIANPIEKNGDFTTVLKHGNGVVLIDEIDLHLHPLWQKEILQALVNTFPNLQFIVTTHSPYVVTHLDLDDKQVQVYSIEKDKVVPIQSKGKDLSTASFEIFGVERRPKMYQKAIDDLFREFEADEPDLSVLDKKFLALKKQLGETDPEVESAKIIIEGLKL